MNRHEWESRDCELNQWEDQDEDQKGLVYDIVGGCVVYLLVFFLGVLVGVLVL